MDLDCPNWSKKSTWWFPLEFGFNFDVKEIGVNWHGMMIKWGVSMKFYKVIHKAIEHSSI